MMVAIVASKRMYIFQQFGEWHTISQKVPITFVSQCQDMIPNPHGVSPCERPKHVHHLL